MEKFYATLLDGVVKHLEEFGCDGIDGFALSHGRFYVVIRTRLFHTFGFSGTKQIAQSA
jgi:hypothetical protein